MSETKKKLNERIKVKKKMKKIELQQAIIKKKQCDAKALTIVEQLLEPNVNPDWLIQNLKFINKTHMEDVIEERVIIKLCGYILCSKPLTLVAKQQYCISTRTNKVYDISKRKKFCSSWCYGASNYLFEQILESPLWLREKEDIPVFKILPINSVQFLPGDEVDVVGINFSQNIDNGDIDKNKEHIELHTTKQTKSLLLSTVLTTEIEHGYQLSDNTSVEEHAVVKEIPTDIKTQSLCETYSSELCTNQQDKEYGLQACTNHKNENNDHIEKENTKSEDLETHIAVQSTHEHDREIENVNISIICSNSDTEILQSQLDISNNINTEILQSQLEISNNTNVDSKTSHQLHEVNNSHNSKDGKIVQFQLKKTCSNQIITISPKPNNDTRNKSKKMKDKNRRGQEVLDESEIQANVCHNLVMHVERSFREWVTKNTLCLLLDEGDEKTQLLENLTQRDRYEQLCKKLNRLQLQDEKEDRVDLGKNVLKPLPHLSVLQEEGKKIELKVRAFYKGQMTIAENSNNKLNNDDEDKEPVLPLTDAHAPNALRRRIFLDKLGKVLPDLLCTLTRMPANASTSSITQSICNNDVYSLIKLLVSTFHLSATNIVFKTAEWTLVGLIIIKMLSLIDTQLQSVLGSKQASMYTSMILMSYKLDSNYLDRFVIDVINNKNTRKPYNKQNLLE